MKESDAKMLHPSAKPNWAIRFAILTWAAALGLVLTFALLWRFFNAPHAIWAVVTTGTMLLAGSLTVLLGIGQLFRGSRRALAAAILLLGTTPIVWSALFSLTMYIKAGSRESLDLGVTTRIVGLWFVSVGDLEARWRYPRWTRGRHVVLLDDGETPAPSKIVADMDEHIERMAARIGVPPPNRQARWVRGPLLGQHGRAVMDWAICDTGDRPAELTYLDRHEMAHVMITLLGGPDQDPSMLLAEGWAESQSKDRADLIINLATELENDVHFSLQELVGPAWYGRSAGPAYDHGGPLVVYLMEHYGPEKFLSLYQGARSATFHEDCERILGDTWPEVEEQFWRWLDREAARLQVARDDLDRTMFQTAEDIELAESVDRAHWQKIVDGYRAAWSKRPPMPERFAFVAERTTTGPQMDAGQEPIARTHIVQCIRNGDEAWHVQSRRPEGTVDYSLVAPDHDASFHVSADGRINRLDRRRNAAQADIRESWSVFVDAADLGHQLPLAPERRYGSAFRILAIRPPSSQGESLWEIDYVVRRPDVAGELTYHVQVDAAAEWSVASQSLVSKSASSELQHVLGKVFGRAGVVEATAHNQNESNESKVVFRLRELDAAESQVVRDQVEAIARSGPSRNWYEPLLSPLALAIVWPSAGMLLAIVGILGRRS